MPILPLNAPEPFAATLGVMLFPGVEEAEQAKARSFASDWLRHPLEKSIKDGHTPTRETLEYVALDGGTDPAELEARFDAGVLIGELFKVLFILAADQPALASWENAVRIASTVTVKSRSSIWDARRRFHTVAHLWAAWTIRDGKFGADPEAGYDGYEDFQSFLTEAEILRDFGQTWHADRAKSKPPLPQDVWRVPDDWRPPSRRSDWSKTGVIPYMSLPPEFTEGLKPPGRPRSEG